MSNYTATAINPSTGMPEQAVFLDNYFGHRKYGVKFGDGYVWQANDIRVIDGKGIINNELEKRFDEEFGTRPLINHPRESLMVFIKQEIRRAEVETAKKIKDNTRLFIRDQREHEVTPTSILNKLIELDSLYE